MCERAPVCVPVCESAPVCTRVPVCVCMCELGVWFSLCVCVRGCIYMGLVPNTYLEVGGCNILKFRKRCAARRKITNFLYTRSILNSY